MKNYYLGLRMAISLLSTIPFIGYHRFDVEKAGYAVLFYPFIGLIFGAIIYMLEALLSAFLPSTFIPFLLFVFFVSLSGAMHLDGLVDTADAYLSRQPERAMEILKDPNVGGLGAVFLILFLLLKGAAFYHLESLLVFMVIPMLSRLGACIAIYGFPYISKGGMGERFKNGFSVYQLLLTTVFSLVVGISLLESSVFLPLFVIMLITTGYFSLKFKRCFGGLNGDMYGFIIEMNELLLLITALVLMQ